MQLQNLTQQYQEEFLQQSRGKDEEAMKRICIKDTGQKEAAVTTKRNFEQSMYIVDPSFQYQSVRRLYFSFVTKHYISFFFPLI